MANYSVKVVINGIDKATAPIRKVMSSLGSMGRMSVFNSMGASLVKVRTAMSGVVKETGHLLVKLGALAAVGGYAFKTLFLDTAIQFEKFETILTQLEGTSAKAKKSMAWISNFAATTPYELGEVTDSFVKLRAYGMNPQAGLLRGLGDASAAMGKSMMQAVEMMADAVTGENERLKEFGIKARAVGKKLVYEYTQNGKTMTKSALKSSRQQIQATLLSIFNAKYAGAMDKLSRTFGGMLSNLKDQWTRLSNTVMSEGLFDFLKGELEGVMNYVNKLMADPKFVADLKAFSRELKTLLVELKNMFVEIWPVIKSVGSALQGMAKGLGGWGNVAKILLVIFSAGLIGHIFKFGAGIFMLIPGMQNFAMAARIAMFAIMAFSTVMNLLETGKTLIWMANVAKNIFMIWRAGGMLGLLMAALTNPITLIIASIVALATAAYLIYTNWSQLSTWFTNMWAEWGGLIRIVAPPIGIIVDLADVIRQNWEPLKKWFEDFWHGIVDTATWAFNQIKAVAGRLPNVNMFTGQRSGVSSVGGTNTSLTPTGKPLLNPGSPYVARTPQRDTLDIAMRIDSEGLPSFTKVDKGGNRNLNFMADMGLVYS